MTKELIIKIYILSLKVLNLEFAGDEEKKINFLDEMTKRLLLRILKDPFNNLRFVLFAFHFL